MATSTLRLSARALKALSEIYPAHGRPVVYSNDLAHRLPCSEKHARSTLETLLRHGLVMVDGDDDDAVWIIERHPRFDVRRLLRQEYGLCRVYAVRREG